jgi:hypothetical protein
MNYYSLFEKLEKHDIKYLICGGLAVNLHGIPRMTADIDIILDLTIDNLQAFQKAVTEVNYVLQIPVPLSDIANAQLREKLIAEKNLIALSWFNYDKHFLQIDVLLKFPYSFEHLWNNRITKMMNNVAVHIVSVQDLIELKSYANRSQDIQDIYYLTQILNRGE